MDLMSTFSTAFEEVEPLAAEAPQTAEDRRATEAQRAAHDQAAATQLASERRDFEASLSATHKELEH
jgi:hypothetical protein